MDRPHTIQDHRPLARWEEEAMTQDQLMAQMDQALAVIGAGAMVALLGAALMTFLIAVIRMWRD
jgi:hypothetical protein